MPPLRDEGWRWGGDVGVKVCPPGVGGAVSPFGAVERSTMTPGIKFSRLTNGSPAVMVASTTGDGDKYGASHYSLRASDFQ